MLAVGVTDDQGVHPAQTLLPEKRDQSGAGGVETSPQPRAGVINQHMIMGTDRHRQAMTHIQQREPELAWGRSGNRKEHQG